MSAEYDDEEYSEELRDNMIVTAYRTFRQDYKKNKTGVTEHLPPWQFLYNAV